MLVKQRNWSFRKNVKTCLQNKRTYDATFKAWSLSSDFNFACKDGRFNIELANTAANFL